MKAKEIFAESMTTDLPLFEMANLGQKYTGIEGTIYISTRQGAHAPRVKYFAGRPGTNQPSMSVLVSENPEIVENNLPTKIVNRMAPRVQEWVKNNHTKLSDFWFNGNSWMKEEVDAFITSLTRYSKS